MVTVHAVLQCAEITKQYSALDVLETSGFQREPGLRVTEHPESVNFWVGWREAFALPLPCLQQILEWSRVSQLHCDTSGNPGSEKFGNRRGKERWGLMCLRVSRHAPGGCCT